MQNTAPGDDLSEMIFGLNGSLIAIHAHLERDPLGPNVRTTSHRQCVVTQPQQAYPLIQKCAIRFDKHYQKSLVVAATLVALVAAATTELLLGHAHQLALEPCTRKD